MSQQRGPAIRREVLGEPSRAACASVMVSPQHGGDPATDSAAAGAIGQRLAVTPWRGIL